VNRLLAALLVVSLPTAAGTLTLYFQATPTVQGTVAVDDPLCQQWRVTADKKVVCAAAGSVASRAEVQRAYVTLYSRPADPDGLSYWALRLDNERSVAAIRSAMAAAPEAASLPAGTGPIATERVPNMLNVADYYTMKVLAGCAYGTEAAGRAVLAKVTSVAATVGDAKTAIDQRCS
jgi:hypothetical protein